MQSLRYYITHVGPTLGSLMERVSYLFHNDERYLKLLFRLKIGTKLDFENPKRFNEKLQWLKLYNQNPEYTDMVDKHKVKNIISEQIGNRYIIPTIGIWNSADEIDWDQLPNQFVLKTTHGGGGTGVVICKDKKNFDKTTAIRKLKNSMKVSGYNRLKEWPYKNVKHRIIAEQYMEDSDNHQFTDYKFHCFNGQPKIVLVCRGRFSSTGGTKDFYDMGWQHLDIRRELNGNADSGFECPPEFTEMTHIAEQLSKGIPFVRIDLYLANHIVYFGEYTFFPASGLSRFYPDKWDFVMGDWLKLPDKN